MQNSLVGDQINNPGLLGPVALTVSADGKSVFVASTVSSAIAVIARQTTAPLLSLAQTLQNGVNGVRALAAPNGLAVSADGRFLFAGVQTDNMAVFEFGNNRWQFVQQVRNNNNNVTGLFAPNAVVIGADASGQSTAYVATLGNPSASELGGIVSFGIATGQPQPHSTAVIFDNVTDLTVNTQGNKDTITFASVGAPDEWVSTTINVGQNNIGSADNVIVLGALSPTTVVNLRAGAGDTVDVRFSTLDASLTINGAALGRHNRYQSGGRRFGHHLQWRAVRR